MEKPNNKLKSWLDRLQQESWELELLISGFTVFLLVNAIPYVRSQVFVFGHTYESIYGIISYIFLIIILLALVIMLINLIFHILLRAVWISAIGLRYVSGQVDIDSLNYTSKFSNFLHKRVGDFDNYIEKIEQICSVTFAFTFLITLPLLQVGFFALAVFAVNLLRYTFLDDMVPYLSIGIIAFGGIYMFDFITQGLLKKNKWVARVYYPIYRLMSWITLSFFFRPLYYNLIDNKFGQRIGWLFIPYLLIILGIAGLNLNGGLYFPKYAPSYTVSFVNYDDQVKNWDYLDREVSLPSKFIRNGFLEVFIGFNPKLENFPLLRNCKRLKETAKPAIEHEFINGFKRLNPSDEFVRSDSLAGIIMPCIQDYYQIHLNDSLLQNVDFNFYQHPQSGESGFLGVIDVESFPRGKHLLKVRRKESSEYRDLAIIPFWKE